jgi:hypothetical protein
LTFQFPTIFLNILQLSWSDLIRSDLI